MHKKVFTLILLRNFYVGITSWYRYVLDTLTGGNFLGIPALEACNLIESLVGTPPTKDIKTEITLEDVIKKLDSMEKNLPNFLDNISKINESVVSMNPSCLSGANATPLGLRSDLPGSPSVFRHDHNSRIRPTNSVPASRNSGHSNSNGNLQWVMVVRDRSPLQSPTTVNSTEPAEPNASLGPSLNKNLHPNLIIKCSNCLAPGHLFSSCTSKIRCKICYNYGHISRDCLSKKRKTLTYRRKPHLPENLLTGRRDDRAAISP